MALSDYLSRSPGFSLRFAVFATAVALAVPAAIGGPSAFAQAAAAQATPDAASARVALPQLQHTLPAGGSDAGEVSSSQPVPAITVTLKRSDAQKADLESFLSGLTTKGSGSYHKWLTPAQFAARFAPTADAVAPVRAWLESQGFTVQSVSAGGMRLVVSGSAAQAETAFAVHLHRYAMASGDQVSVTGTPTVPSALAASIRAVSGLDSTSATSTEPVSVLADAVDANTNPVVVADLAAASASAADLASVLEQASAQGQSVLVLHASAALTPSRALAIELASDIPTASASAAAAASASAATPAAASSAAAATDPTTPVNTTTRPDWQNAPGLPSDGLREAPDAAVGADTSALTAGIQSVITKAGQRQGEVAAIFYQLAPEQGIFTHADTTIPAGTWTAADGLGTVNVDALVKAWPYGATNPLSSTLSVSANTVTHGSNLTLTIQINGGSGTPTGTVTIGSSQGGTLATVTLNGSGGNVYTTNAIAGGQYGFFGTYNGDNTYATSTTNVDTVTVNPEAALVTGAASGSYTVGGTIPVTVTVKSPSGVGQPAGTVTVNPYGTAVGSQTYTGTLAATSTAGTSSATVNVPATSGGTFQFQTNCTTDASFSCYQPASFSVTVAKATPTVAVTQTGSATAATLTATVAAPAGSNSSVAVPTGYVQFMDGSTVLGGHSLNASGMATYSGALGTGSTHSITAQYQGDTSYNTATGSTSSTVKTTPTVALTAAAGSTAASANLTATITPPAGSTTVATGTVQFLDGTTPLSTANVGTNGVATYSGALTGTGTTHPLTAVYSGDTNYNIATSNTVSIGAGTVKPTVTLSATSGSTPTAATLNVTVAPPSGTTTVATGTVQFLDGATVLATNTLVNGATSYSGALTGTSSSHTLTAVYSGDATYASGTSNAVTIGTALITTTTSLTSSSGYSGPAGTTFNMITLVTPASTATSGAAPSGIITITDSVSGVVGTGTLASGTVTISLSSLGVGQHSLTASYPGDGNYAASTSAPAVITVVTATGTLAATLSPTGTVPYGYNATINATVTLSAGTNPPAGSVTATVSGGNGTYTATLSGTAGSAAGTATISFPVPPPGTYTITVMCNNGVSCTPQTVTLSITTTKGYTTTTVTTLTPTNPQAGVPVSVTATVANSGTGTGTYTYSGTVSFYTNGKFFCSAPVSNGSATCSGVFLTTASQLITAQYSGDTNWNGSTSTSGITVVPSPIPVSIALSANTTNAIVGQNVTLTAAVSSGVNNSTLVPSGSITFYDTYNGIVVNLGSAPLLSNGLNTSYAQLSTTGLQAGVHNIMAVYAGDSIFLQTTSTTLVIHVGDFTVTFIPSSLQLAQGGTGTATVLVNAVGSFAGQIALGCTPPPSSLSTCNVTQSVVNAGGTAQITITTTKSTSTSSSVIRSGVLDTSTRIAAVAGVGGLLSLLLLRRRRIAALFLLLVMAAAMAGGCTVVDSTANSDGGTSTGGGGTSNNGTPLGTVNFTVTAASVSQPVNARHNFLLPVTTQ